MAAAKQAGYFVTAIDAFADKETALLADEVILSTYNSSGFDRTALLDAVCALKHAYTGFIYGSGFEEQPDLLAELNAHIPLIGNSPATVLALKDPYVFFPALQRLHIRHPLVFKSAELTTQPVKPADIYLNKRIGGCGGVHISIANQDNAHSSNTYCQQYVAGRAVSLLFIARTNEIELIGFNEQWTSPEPSSQFRYGGAVGNIELSASVKQQLLDAASKISAEFNLLGLNSLDAIVQDELAYVLEINPRLSATVELYDKANLLEKHIQACRTANNHAGLQGGMQAIDFKSEYLTTAAYSKAHAIVYADTDLLIKHDFNWPAWVVDTPQLANKIKAGEPVCSAVAHADNAEQAKQLAHIRVKMIKIELLTQ